MKKLSTNYGQHLALAKSNQVANDNEPENSQSTRQTMDD